MAVRSTEALTGSQYSFALPFKALTMKDYGPIDSLLFNKKLEGVVDLLVGPVPCTQNSAGCERSQGELSEESLQPSQPKRLGRSPVPEDAVATTSATRIHSQKTTDEPHHRVSKHCLLNLPPELLHMIAAESDGWDLVPLGLTCQQLWEVISGPLADSLCCTFGQWRMTGLVFIGGHCDADDYPVGLFSDDEIAQIGQRRVQHVNPGGEDDDVYYVTTLSDFVSEEQRPGHRDTDAAPLARMAEFAPDTYTPRDVQWRLLDVDAAEYVRAEGIAVAAEYIHGPHIDHIGFAEVLMVRTCWAAVHAFADGELPIPAKGPWAGHVFAIMTDAELQEFAKELAEDVPGVHLQDVSDEVAAEMHAIWAAKFGAGWREVISAPDFAATWR